MFYWYAEPVFSFNLICSFVVHHILFWLLRWLLWDITCRKNLFCVMTFTSDVWGSDLYLNELKWHLLQQGEKIIFKSVSAEMINTIYQNWVLVSVYTKYHCVVSSSGLLIIIFKAQRSALWLCKQQRLPPPHSSNRLQESVALWKKRKADFSPVSLKSRRPLSYEQ